MGIRMELINRKMTGAKERPVKILQFGEGNFLRGFVDPLIDIANETGYFDGSIVLVRPRARGGLEQFRAQEYQYTVSLRGLVDGKKTVVNRVITSVADAVDTHEDFERYIAYAKLDSLRFVVSNTTEAGIVYEETDLFTARPQKSYPGKLTAFLYARYQHFQGDFTKGLILLPVELIDDNGIRLKECVQRYAALWQLEEGFLQWLDSACVFCSTLVDRIVTGYPKEEAAQMWEEFGYQDQLMVTGEPFALWVIESEREISEELPLANAGLPVIFTEDQKPYKQRKVRILNGAHTSFALASYLMGHDIVLDAMGDELVRDYMRDTIFEEVIPTLTLPRKELEEFADAVMDRFCNPFLRHSLLAISLNSVSKWRARCMPSFLTYLTQFKTLPGHLTFSLAALIAFYQGTKLQDGALIGSRNGEEYKILDDTAVLMFFAANADRPSGELCRACLARTDFWGEDLSKREGVADAVSEDLERIRTFGMRAAMEQKFGTK